ncbi:hypothetical protein MFLAVUS_007889 [Mucor flavus]|uniref:Uncharacterized protein n=1 Tax=Mucor flavus TaxID=439312 RepID=A0ABP9Z5J1_9FUNG
MLSSITKGAQGNSLGLHHLTVEMEKSNTKLENIQRLLKSRNVPKKTNQQQEQWQLLKQEYQQKTLLLEQECQQKTLLLEQECQQKTLVLKVKEEEFIEKNDLLSQAQRQITELQQALDLLGLKYKQGTIDWRQQQSNNQYKYDELEQDFKELIEKNNKLEDMIDQLKEGYERSSREKEHEFQRNLKCVQQQKTNECSTLQDKIDELQLENQQYKKRIEEMNAIHNPTHEEEEEENDHSSNIKKSRIPVLTSRSIQQQMDIKREMNLMKDDLLLFQDKLVEKISQNKQLESAIERMNEHCQILRKSLNETREESADRYRRMIKYMQENKLLKDQLDQL